MYPLSALFKTVSSDELVMMFGGRSERSNAQHRCHMMPRHPHCDGKLHFNVYRMDKLLACGVNGKLQSSLPMPSWSKHCSSRLSELPITSGKVAEHTGMASEATWQRRTASGPSFGRTPVLPVGESRPIGSRAEPASRFRKTPPY